MALSTPRISVALIVFDEFHPTSYNDKRDRQIIACGWVSEWFMVAVLKTAVPKGTVGSNPSPSAILFEANKSFYIYI